MLALNVKITFFLFQKLFAQRKLLYTFLENEQEEYFIIIIYYLREWSSNWFSWKQLKMLEQFIIIFTTLCVW